MLLAPMPPDAIPHSQPVSESSSETRSHVVVRPHGAGFVLVRRAPPPRRPTIPIGRTILVDTDLLGVETIDAGETEQ